MRPGTSERPPRASGAVCAATRKPDPAAKAKPVLKSTGMGASPVRLVLLGEKQSMSFRQVKTLADRGTRPVMADPIKISRRIRRRIDQGGLHANIAADVNIAVSTGGGTATVRQDAPIRQGRSRRTASEVSEPKEQL